MKASYSQFKGDPWRGPAVGKLSIGIPADEPAMVNEQLVGKRLLHPVAGVSSDKVITKSDLTKFLRAGLSEVVITHGRFPQQLKNDLRLTRRADTLPGFLWDPAFASQFLGTPEGWSVMLLWEDNNVALHQEMANLDRQRHCVFCHSLDGEVFTRLEEDADGQYTGKEFQGECIPFYGDRAREPGKSICEYRVYGHRRPCQYTAVLWFQIFPKDPEEFFAGSHIFKIETTSAKTGQLWWDALEAIRAEHGRISWIPLKIKTVEVEQVIPRGAADGKVKTKKTQHTTIEFDPEFPTAHAERLKLVSGWAQKYVIPKEVMTDAEVGAWTAEFMPGARLSENAVVSAETKPAAASARGADFASMHASRMLLEASAMQLKPEDYKKFSASLELLTPDKLELYQRRVYTLIEELTLQDRKTHFEANSQTHDPATLPV